MVNSKRMSKSKVAMIALAILLVLSLILTATGAWFTDKETNPDTITDVFGTVAIDLEKSGSASDVGFYASSSDSTVLDRDLLPGDQVRIKINVQKATDSSDFYYVVKATVNIYGGELKAANGAFSANGNAATAQNPITLDGAWRGASSTTAYSTYGEVDASIVLDGETVYGDLYQGATVVVTYEVRAIQQAHITNEQAFTMLTTDWVEGGLIAIPTTTNNG